MDWRSCEEPFDALKAKLCLSHDAASCLPFDGCAPLRIKTELIDICINNAISCGCPRWRVSRCGRLALPSCSNIVVSRPWSCSTPGFRSMKSLAVCSAMPAASCAGATPDGAGAPGLCGPSPLRADPPSCPASSAVMIVQPPCIAGTVLSGTFQKGQTKRYVQSEIPLEIRPLQKPLLLD